MFIEVFVYSFQYSRADSYIKNLFKKNPCRCMALAKFAVPLMSDSNLFYVIINLLHKTDTCISLFISTSYEARDYMTFDFLVGTLVADATNVYYFTGHFSSYT